MIDYDVEQHIMVPDFEGTSVCFSCLAIVPRILTSDMEYLLFPNNIMISRCILGMILELKQSFYSNLVARVY